MKFGYSYKTSDGIRHEDAMMAKKKEDVFSALRERHIKAMKVWEIRSPWAVSKRTQIIVILSLSLAAVCYLLHQSFLRGPEVKIVERTIDYRNAQPLPRKQIRGLPSDLSCVLPLEADIYLANFAQPGRLGSKEMIGKAADAAFCEAIQICLTNPVRYVANEPAPHAEIKCVVEGLKQEIKTYCNTGRSISRAISFLADRQRMEYEHRESLKAKVSAGTMTLDAANADCKAMGLAPMVQVGEDGDAVIERELKTKDQNLEQLTLLTYKKACQAGRAAAPTNALQKQIWDEVHAPPKNPMKIEFDPKKGR